MRHLQRISSKSEALFLLQVQCLTSKEIMLKHLLTNSITKNQLLKNRFTSLPCFEKEEMKKLDKDFPSFYEISCLFTFFEILRHDFATNLFLLVHFIEKMKEAVDYNKKLGKQTRAGRQYNNASSQNLDSLRQEQFRLNTNFYKHLLMFAS